MKSLTKDTIGYQPQLVCCKIDSDRLTAFTIVHCPCQKGTTILSSSAAYYRRQCK
jgi:hypothetical protein